LSTIFDTLTEIEATDLETDLLGSGPNLRIRAGEITRFVVEDRTAYFKAPPGSAGSLTRIALSDQNGMTVLRAAIAVRGESVGLVGENDTLIPLPCYTQPAFGTWRSWIHIMNVEFMNVDAAGAQQLIELALKHGFVPYAPRQASDYERKTTPVFDREAPGSTINARFEKGIQLESFVLVPDERVDVLTTEYTDKEGVDQRRPAFTNFLDALIVNMGEAIKANAGDDRDAKRKANNRLSILTGHNSESDWPLRPTLGYLTPVKGDEISLFGDRGASASSDATESPVETDVPDPGADDQPFAPSE
jgi:hypothetical protein